MKKSPAKRSARSGRRPSASALSSFDGANRGTGRGYIYFPTLDTSRELDTYSHWELVKKGRWFFANSGFARRCVLGLANMVGYLTPRPLTGDEVWNELALKNFETRAGSAQVCDLAGKNNFYSYQVALDRADLKDGDILTALTKTASGGAAFLGYEAHQIGNTLNAADGASWVNGIKLDRFNKHLAYRLITADGSTDIDARDAIYYGDFERLNQPRGITGFAHAINHLHDMTEIVRDVKLGIKSANQVGLQLTRPGTKNSSTSRRMGANRVQLAPDPAKPNEKIDLEDVYRGGKVTELFDGAELKTVLDPRPHPNQMVLLDYLVRDMSWGFGVSPEVLWFVGKINGTSNRFILADAMKWVTQRQQRKADTFCRRYWVYHIACEMKAGRLPPCQDPEWWKVGWIPQAALTVDRGRDGKLYIDLHKSAMITLSRHYDEQFSEDWKPNIDQWMNELAYMRDGLRQRGFDSMAEVQALLGASNVPLATPDPNADPTVDPSADPTVTDPGADNLLD